MSEETVLPPQTRLTLLTLTPATPRNARPNPPLTFRVPASSSILPSDATPVRAQASELDAVSLRS